MENSVLNSIHLSRLNSVNKSQLKKLNKLGIFTIQDLLLHLPIRYEDRTHTSRISNLMPGIWATVEGNIIHTNQIILGLRRILVLHLSDGSGILYIKFFNFNSRIFKNKFCLGKHITVYGQIKHTPNGFEMMHPEYVTKMNKSDLKIQKTLTPIYPSTEGIHQTSLRNLIDQALKIMNDYNIHELLPPKISCKFISLQKALYILHRPPRDMCLQQWKTGDHPAQKRLILEELLAHILRMLALRAEIKTYQALPIQSCPQLTDKLLSTLPFSLTNAQRRVLSDIEHDLSHGFPMMRLLQGDVGSGKTIIAALAALNVISSSKQVALMAPTELLAEQHVHNFVQWFKPLDIKIGLLTGKKKGKDRTTQQQTIANGQVNMVIGTHALFQKQVKFNDIGLIIIDEQHRFGVHQRLAFLEKGKELGWYPHQLIMTATPIPRTLAKVAYADLDISILDELPPGRKPVITVAIPNYRRNEIITRIKIACNQGRQVYWVCTVIDKSNVLEVQAAIDTLQELKLALPDLYIGLLHGRMTTTEKQTVMQSFQMKQIDLLVTTTVIEVGVDVANASLMVIENSERLGLAQLHQLRGRIGRSEIASYCVLMYKIPLNKIAEKRLHVLRTISDGFVIAQHDLKIRGPGELLGTKQTGNTKFKIANLIRDEKMITLVRHIADDIYHKYPTQAKLLMKRWLSKHACDNNQDQIPFEKTGNN